MPDLKASDTSQLHRTEEYDQETAGLAPDVSTRSAADAGNRPSAAQGAVETEVTPMTPPSADTDGSDTAAKADDDDWDPAAEITPG